MKPFLLLLTIAYMSGCMEASHNDTDEWIITPIGLDASDLPSAGPAVHRGPLLRIADGLEICSIEYANNKKLRNECAENTLRKVGWREPPNSYNIQNITEPLSNKYMTGEVSLSNLKLSGWSNLRLSNVQLRKEINSERYSDEIHLVANFKGKNMRVRGNINGNLLFSGLELAPNGTFNVKSDEVTVRISVTVKKLLYWPPISLLYFRKVHPQIKPSNLYIYATGLDPDPTINAGVVQILNKNWRNIYTEGLIKEFQKQWVSYWTYGANQLAISLARIP